MTARCNSGSGCLSCSHASGSSDRPAHRTKSRSTDLAHCRASGWPARRGSGRGWPAHCSKAFDDGFVLGWIVVALVDDSPRINPVLQHQVERTAGDRPAAVPAAIGGGADLADNAGTIEVLLQFLDRLEFGVAPEDMSDGLGFCVVEDELAVFDVVAKRGLTAHPHALLLGGRYFVTDALACDLALELGK